MWERFDRRVFTALVRVLNREIASLYGIHGQRDAEVAEGSLGADTGPPGYIHWTFAPINNSTLFCKLYDRNWLCNR